MNKRPKVERCYKIIGLRLRHARLWRGLSQQQAANKANKRGKRGLSRAHIANIERGEQRIWPHQVAALAKIYGRDPAAFFDGIWS